MVSIDIGIVGGRRPQRLSSIGHVGGHGVYGWRRVKGGNAGCIYRGFIRIVNFITSLDTRSQRRIEAQRVLGAGLIVIDVALKLCQVSCRASEELIEAVTVRGATRVRKKR